MLSDFPRTLPRDRSIAASVGAGSLLLGSLLSGAVALAPAALAAPPAQCIDTLYIADNASGDVRPVDVTTGAVGAALYDATPSGTAVPNQNGIGRAGAYAINATPTEIVYRDLAADTTRVTPKQTEAGVNAVAGAVDPASGLYFYGGYNGSQLTLWTYDPDTDATSTSPVARIDVPAAPGGNGDLAFDSTGQLYFVAASASTTSLYRFDEDLPRSGPTQTFASSAVTTLTTTTGLSAASNGIAFASDGFLYLGTVGQITKVNPITGDRLTSIPFTGASVQSTDLASCAGPNAVEVTVELPDGRIDPDDQFDIDLTGGDYDGDPAFPGGTTTGGEDGAQDQEPGETGGPGLVLPDQDYTVEVTGSGDTDIDTYVQSYTCRDAATGEVVSSGPGTSYTLNLPSGTGTIADCVVTLAKPAPALTLSKQVSPSSFDAIGDELTYTFTIENTGNVDLSDLAVTDPLDGLSALTCDPVAQGGTLAVDATTTCTATYEVTGPDVRSGEDIENTATVAGTPPPKQGDRISTDGSATASNDAAGPDANDDSRGTEFGQPVTLPGATDDTAGSSPIVPGQTVLTSPDATDGGKTLVVDGQGAWEVQDDGTVTFTPADGFAGQTDPVTYEVTDENGLSSTADLQVTVRPGPDAQADTGTGDQGQTVTVGVLDNDTPGPLGNGDEGSFDPATVVIDPATIPDGSTLSEDGRELVVPGEGTWTVDEGTGELTFDPEDTFTGPTTEIGYVVDDQAGNTTGSTVVVTIAPVDPTANDDTASTPYDTAVSLPAGNDDTAGPGGPIDQSLTVLTSPEATDGGKTLVTDEGTWQVGDDGFVTFTPAPGYVGTTPPVTYRITDANGQTDTADLSVTVRPGPVAQPDDATTAQNVDVTLSPLDDDTAGQRADGSAGALDPATLVLLAGGLPEGSELSEDGRTLTVPGEGTWTVDPDSGEITFDPEPTFRGEASTVGYSVQDQAGNTASSTLDVTVTPIDPVATDDAAKTPAGTPVTLDVLANDRAGADSAPLAPGTVTLTSPRATDGGTRLENEDGVWVVEADGRITFTPAPGFEGTTDPVEYAVADSNGTTATASMTVEVGSAPLAAPDTESTPQGQPVTVTLLDNDVPGDLGSPCDPPSSGTPAGCDTGSWVTDTLRFEPGPGQAGTVSDDGATITVPGEGTWVIGDDGTVDLTPEPSFTGTTSPVTYTVTDSYGNDASATATVVVRPISPVANDDAAVTPFGTPVTLPGATDDEPGTDDNGTADTADDTTIALRPAQTVFSQTGQPDGAQRSADGGTLVVPGEGTWQVQPDGSVEFTPADGFSGTTTPVSYDLFDANGTTDSADLSVTVRPGPTAQPDTGDTPQGVPVTLTPLDNDTAGQQVDGSDGTLRPGSVRLVLGPGLPAGSELDEGGTTLVVPGEGTWTVGDDGAVEFAPEPTFTGQTSPVPYTVTDSLGNDATSTLTVTVDPVNPTATDDTATTPFGTPVVLSGVTDDLAGADTAPLRPAQTRFPSAGQPDGVVIAGDQKTVTLIGVGVWQIRDDGTILFTPADGFSGTTPAVTYEITDANGTTDTATLIVDVGAPATATPVDEQTTEGDAVTVDVLDGVTPATGEDLQPGTVCLLPSTVTWTTAQGVQRDGAFDGPDDTCVKEYEEPGVGTWVVNPDGSVTFTPAPGFTGDVDIDFQVEDTGGNVVGDTLTVSVEASPVSPTPTTPTTPTTPDAGPGGSGGGILPTTGGPALGLGLAGLAALMTGLLLVRRTRRA